MNTYISICLMLFLTACSHQQVRPNVRDLAGEPPALRKEAHEILIRTLSPHVFALQRRVYLYHYGRHPKGEKGPVDPLDQSLAARYFYDPKSGRDYFKPNMTYSLYMANNPVVSIDYAKSPSLLSRIGVPPGIKYLDKRNLVISKEDSLRLDRILGKSPGSTGTVGDKLNLMSFIETSPDAAELLREAFKELGIQMLSNGFRRKLYDECPGDNPEVMFIDPTLAPQLDMTLYSPVLEANPSAQKLDLYREVFRFFEIVTADEVKAIQNSVEPKYWEYYKAWAPVIYGLPASSDWVKIQKEKSEELKTKRREWLREMFACSDDPRFSDEVLQVE